MPSLLRLFTRNVCCLFQDLFGICWDDHVMNWWLQSVSVVLMKSQSWIRTESLGLSRVTFLILLSLSAENVGSVWPCLFPGGRVCSHLLPLSLGHTVPFPNQLELLFLVEESDSRESSCPFAFLLFFCPRFAHNGHFQEIVKSCVVWRKSPGEGMYTSLHCAAPGTHTVSLANPQTFTNLSPALAQCLVASGLESPGWHVSSPCRHHPTLGFGPVSCSVTSALWWVQKNCGFEVSLSFFVKKGESNAPSSSLFLRTEVAGLSDKRACF